MAFRLLLALLGLLEVAFPKPLVDFWMNLATEDDDVELRPWVYTAARIEGALILLYVLWRRKAGE
ncbi:hypothetical protein KY092_09730 [Natronomonas gomsonensis]|uniref:hypothetical protein n=1 Tax=Natronomonas gomsonensis TaxID=1046043 RepID=UPI0020CA86C0|nr:hypothetical protein [Natronomonas gomsonensis]MCY4730836.1 hypothetical protein [Natronomonas gomsonensis]